MGRWGVQLVQRQIRGGGRGGQKIHFPGSSSRGGTRWGGSGAAGGHRSPASELSTPARGGASRGCPPPRGPAAPVSRRVCAGGDGDEPAGASTRLNRDPPWFNAAWLEGGRSAGGYRVGGGTHTPPIAEPPRPSGASSPVTSPQRVPPPSTAASPKAEAPPAALVVTETGSRSQTQPRGVSPRRVLGTPGGRRVGEGWSQTPRQPAPPGQGQGQSPAQPSPAPAPALLAPVGASPTPALPDPRARVPTPDGRGGEAPSFTRFGTLDPPAPRAGAAKSRGTGGADGRRARQLGHRPRDEKLEGDGTETRLVGN